MQLSAKLIQLLPLQTGTGRNGQWKKQDIIVETEGGQFPKKVCVSIWGDKIDTAQLRPGSLLKIDFDIESREYNGRWYTDVKAWRVEPAGSSGPTAAPSAPIDSEPAFKADDDLPF